jgi:hypothetical protein
MIASVQGTYLYLTSHPLLHAPAQLITLLHLTHLIGKPDGIICHRGYHETKLQENLDAEIFGVLVEEAREAFDGEIVVELNSEEDGDVEGNCARICSWIDNWKSDQAKNTD